MASVVLDNLSKTFPHGVRAVDGLTLQVGDGELLVLMGPSGCGKTTTLRLIAGLERPTRGTILIDGRVMNDAAPKDRNLAMVFQTGALYPHLSVYGNLALGLKLRHVGRAEIERRVAETASLLHIGDLLTRRPAELSGGQRQRVALGRALARRPPVILFDEPLSQLDAALRRQMRHEIHRLHSRFPSTMIYVTHDQAEAVTLGERIAVLREGRFEQLADPQTLYQQPVNRFVAAAIGGLPMNFLRGRMETEGGQFFLLLSAANEDSGEEHRHPALASSDLQRLRITLPESCGNRVASYVGRTVLLGIRPEHLAAPAGSAAGAVRMSGIVEALEPAGAETYVQVRVAGQLVACRMQPVQKLLAGERVEAVVAAEHLYFFDPISEKTIF